MIDDVKKTLKYEKKNLIYNTCKHSTWYLNVFKPFEYFYAGNTFCLHETMCDLNYMQILILVFWNLKKKNYKWKYLYEQPWPADDIRTKV